ncbi:MAG: hypothetical protein MMC33_001145 [Icmadophila ericetorum]|nr:hypothetical protein [Icmadophila ericetorum]
MESLKILLIGNGGREHALAWKLNQSPRVEVIYVCPGNGGTADASLEKVQNISNVKPEDFPSLIAFALEKKVNLVVPGPEAPLVSGIEGPCRAAGLRCFGPSKAAARMEGSKTFAKDFMSKHNIPTAEYQNFSNYELAKAYLDSVSHNVVLKASGLAAGKGVILPSSKQEAQEALEQIMLKKDFGAAGDEVVIEEYLEGEELSFLSFSDGYTIRSLPPAQDHKQVYDGDKGPNTGGMGCYAPTKVATPELIKEIHDSILQPTIDGMRRDATPFVGLLFTGLMITKSGPKTLEYNVRFGDPETQTLLPLLSSDTDLAEIMVACTEHWLDAVQIKVDPKFSATVVASAGGYPGPYIRGGEIQIEKLDPSNLIFHAGTLLSSGVLRTSGGRVIASTSTGVTLEAAINNAYKGVSSIKFRDMHYRKDIGHRALRPRPKVPNTSGKGEKDETDALTYASAGVSIADGNDLVNLITPLAALTARPGADAEIGGFGGVLDLSDAGYMTPPIIIGAIDGVGTKLFIAQAMNKHDTVGIDLVAMNVNDLVVQGAEALFFLDCFSCGKLNVNTAADFVRGVVEGCKQAGCALVGGETAEMPGLFANSSGVADRFGEVYDAVGAAVGALQKGKKLLPDKDAMKSGDVLLGIASNGCHSNGFSLIRKIIERANLKVTDTAPWQKDTTVGESLLTPTRIYVKQLLEVVKKNLVKGMSHITGGGLLENIPRMLPKHLAAEVDVSSWPVPSVFHWLKTEGKLSDMEFARAFNTGIGMVLVVSEECVEEATSMLTEAGEKVYKIGKVVERGGEGCILKNIETWR